MKARVRPPIVPKILFYAIEPGSEQEQALAQLCRRHGILWEEVPAVSYTHLGSSFFTRINASSVVTTFTSSAFISFTAVKMCIRDRYRTRLFAGRCADHHLYRFSGPFADDPQHV